MKTVHAAGAALVLTTATAQVLSVANATSGYINYTTVTGYFLQDLATTNVSTFNYVSSSTLCCGAQASDNYQTATNFGLINQTYPGSAAGLTQWQSFEQVVDALNAAAPLNTIYKVLFAGRHGEGFHNAAETFYGTPAWNCYWSLLDGNATTVWEDADLTNNGIAQAQIAHNFWQHEITTQHIPYPQSYYTSPLTRCLRTANMTFSGLDLPVYYPFVPTVKELLREGISLHTCDHRSNRTYIHERFPTYEIEPTLTEYDEIWNGVTAETSA